MGDSLDPDDPRPFLLQDCYTRNPSNPRSDILVRSGWYREFAGPVTSGVYASIYEFTTLAGTTQVVLTINGKFYTLDLSGYASVTETVTTAQLTAASITLGTGPVYFATFNNQLVVSDGTNTPWMWDGTAGAGLTKLTNAPVAYGAPTVYYARLFFIKNTDRGAIVWSEVNAANTGYEAGGYNNAWTLGQTGSQTITAIHGTNEGLYYWRTSSIGLIRGAVTSTFSTTGTHDAISSSVGTLGPTSSVSTTVTAINERVYFYAADQTAWRLDPGGALTELIGPNSALARRYGIDEEQIAVTAIAPFNIGQYGTRGQGYGFIRDVPRGAILAVHASGTANSPIVAVLNEITGALMGTEVWNGVGTKGFAATPVSRYGLMLAYSINGQVVTRGRLGASTIYGSDQTGLSSTNVAFTPTVIGPALGYGEATDWSFDEMDVVFEGNSTDSSALIKTSYLTDQLHYSTLVPAFQTSTAYDATYAVKEQRTSFGINGHGAWIRPYIQLSSTGRMALKSVSVLGFPVEDTVEVA